jgi:hypothetical protein
MNLNPWSVALGVILTGVLSYLAVPLLVEHVYDEVKKQTAPNEPEKVRKPTYGGDIVGYLECMIFFVSFLWVNVIVLAPAWLVLKTAAKWKTWDTLKNINPEEVPVWYRVFLVGTAANVVAALAGVAVAHIP